MIATVVCVLGGLFSLAMRDLLGRTATGLESIRGRVREMEPQAFPAEVLRLYENFDRHPGFRPQREVNKMLGEWLPTGGAVLWLALLLLLLWTHRNHWLPRVAALFS